MSFWTRLFGSAPVRDNANRSEDAFNPVVPSADSSSWKFEKRTLISRAYEFPRQRPGELGAYLRIECSVTRYLNGNLGTYLFFVLRPYVDLMPDRQPLDPDDGILSVPFSVGLVADGSGAGTQASPLVRGGIVKVGGCAIWDQPDTISLDVVSAEDTALCINAISTGQPLTFTILDHESDRSVKLRLRLDNDLDFKKAYKRICDAV